MTFHFKDITEEKELLIELRKKQPDIGVTTETLNRLPVFQPTLKPMFQERSFENAYGRITVIGRLGQSHKNLLETILYKRKVYKSYKDAKGNRHFEVLYDEYEVRRYLSRGTTYSQERYQELIEDMKQAYIEIETKELTVRGKFIADKTFSSKYSKLTKSNLPGLKDQEIPYAVLVLGDVLNTLISKELTFPYDPKPITQLSSGVSQAVVRLIKTHKNHPKAGYHLKPLIEGLTGNVEGQKWYNIKTQLKRDADKLKTIFLIAIDFEKERLFKMECKANGKIENLS